MATAPAVRGPRTVWHVRGTWSARDDRAPSAVWLAILWVGMIAGFGTDIPNFARESPPPPTILWVHGAVFTTWLLLLTTQVLLVLGNRVPWHRKLGWFMAGWACVMAVIGPWAAMVSSVRNLHNPANGIPAPFLSVIIENIACFAALLAWGITLRKNPAAHRRMMILSTVALADPGFSRFTGFLWPTEPSSVPVWFFYTFYGNVLLMVLMAAWDWWRGRLMRSFVIGAGLLLSGEITATLLYFWGPWRALTLGWVETWARLRI